MRTWDDLLQDMGYARRRARRFWRGRRPSRSARRIMRNRRCEEAGFTALLGAETGQADLEEALERALRETAGDYYCPAPGGF